VTFFFEPKNREEIDRLLDSQYGMHLLMDSGHGPTRISIAQVLNALRPVKQNSSGKLEYQPDGLGATREAKIGAIFSDPKMLGGTSAHKICQEAGIPIESVDIALQRLASSRGEALLANLERLGVNFSSVNTVIEVVGPVAGKTFVITGVLPNLSRSEATNLIEASGGKVTNSVTKRTSYLLVGSEGGSKLSDAERLEVPVISTQELLKMISPPSQQGALF
jgi:NAD-dependent DNA ligase